MGHLFGSKKQEYQARTEAQTIETFRILSLMYCDTHDDMKTSDIGPLERKMFGKTFEDLLQEGYMVTLVIEDKESGDFWTAFGKAQKEDDMQESAVLQDDADLDQSHHSRMSRQKAGTSTSKDSPIKFVLVELYEEIEEVALKQPVGPFYALPEPIFPAAMALMIQDVCHDAFSKLARDPKLWHETQKRLMSDKQVAAATLINILTPYFGVPPVYTVSALLIKIGINHLLWIDKDEKQFERIIANKLLIPIIQETSIDHFAINLLASRLHKKRKNIELCKRRLIECESLCRQQNTLADLNSVGYEYIEIGEVERGLELVKEAAAIAPDDPGLIDSLAWAHYKHGQIGIAFAHIKRALIDENVIIQDYTAEGLLEILYHAVVIAHEAKDIEFEQRVFLRLKQLDSEEKWVSKLNIDALLTQGFSPNRMKRTAFSQIRRILERLTSK